MIEHPLLVENPDRYVMFPIQYQDIWRLYKKQQSTFWTAEEILLTDDIVQWNHRTELTDSDKYFIEHILAFFASADGIVGENIAGKFYTEIQIPEARSFYAFQLMMEHVHSEVYSLLIETLVNDEEKKTKLFRDVKHFPAIKKMADWAINWMNSDTSYDQRLIANACVEGIFFSGPFCAIFWLKQRGLLPGLTQSNESISRDEGLHVEFGCLLHNIYDQALNDLSSTMRAEEINCLRTSSQQILDIVISSVEVSKEFINESLPCSLIGMNSKEMSTYIEYIADRLLVMLNQPKYWNAENPFKWMVMISTQNKTNFFEKRVTDYSKAEFNQQVLSGQKKTGIQLIDNF